MNDVFVIVRDGSLAITPAAGKIRFTLEDGDGRRSRWNMLRVLRVVNWDVAARQRARGGSQRTIDERRN